MTRALPLTQHLRRIAGEMERHLGPPEMAPGPDPDDLIEAADAIERLTKERDEHLRLKNELVLKAYPAMDERDRLLAELAEMRDKCAGCLRQDEKDEALATAEADLARAREALTQAEACMSIVEPRSDKAEYLRILGVIRAALAPEGK